MNTLRSEAGITEPRPLVVALSPPQNFTRVLFNCQTPLAYVAADVSGCGLSGSPEGFPRTPQLYRTRLLRMSLKVSLFRRGFELRCFQLLSRSAWLLSDALPDN